MTVTEMGHGHSRTTNNSTREPQIRSGGSRVLHKMDRGEASSQHSGGRVEKIFLVEHNMSF
jgi:hypothetical protein